jgi:hypothetical protein
MASRIRQQRGANTLRKFDAEAYLRTVDELCAAEA